MAGPWDKKPVRITYRNVLTNALEAGTWTASFTQRVVNTPSSGDAVVYRANTVGSGNLNTTEGSPSIAFSAPVIDDPDVTPAGGQIILNITFTSGGTEEVPFAPHVSWPDSPGYVDLAVGPVLATVTQITTTGSTFSPKLELAPGSSATVTWTDDQGTTLATGLNPLIDFGTSATRTVRLVSSVPGDVITLNMGFDHTEDPGIDNLGAGYDYPSQSISGVTNLGYLTGLKNFAAAGTNLTGHLNLTGLSALQYVECFQAHVQQCTLTGCSSLIRLCLEQNNLNTALNLNPVRTTLKDFRAAAMRTGALTLTTLTGNLTNLWHFCTRDQTLVGFPTFARLPVVKQCWIWNNGLTTADQPVSAALDSLLAYQNSFNGTGVDNILVGLNSTGPNGGAVDLSGSATPGSTGTTAATALTGKGWTVTLSAPLLQDTFATASGLWSGTAAASYSVAGGNFDLVTPASGFSRAVNGTALPDDISIRATRSSAVTDASNTRYFGIFGRWDGTSGVQVFINPGGSITVGDAAGYAQSPQTPTFTATHPTTWTTLRADMQGATVNVYLDTTLVWTGPTNIRTSGGTGRNVGFLGEPSDMDQLWTDITVLGL